MTMGIKQNILVSLIFHIILFSLSFSVNFRERSRPLPEDYINVLIVEQATNTTKSENLFSLYPPQVLERNMVYKERIASPDLALRNMGFFIHLMRTQNDRKRGGDIRQDFNRGQGTTEDTKKETLDISINNVAVSEEMNTLHANTKDNEFNPPSLPSDPSSSPLSNKVGIEEGIGKIQSSDVFLKGTKKGVSNSQKDKSLYAFIRSAIEQAKNYPLLARKRGFEGTVIVSFKIDEMGLPQDIKILKSSGYQILDDEVTKILRKASPFPELKEEIVIPITFRLKECISDP